MKEYGWFNKLLDFIFERKLFCLIGWHTWEWKHEDGNIIYINKGISNKAKCRHCNKAYKRLVMTPNELKELYATGQLIIVTHVYNGKWMIDERIYPVNTQKLIHKKHKDILDHVLAGGEVKWNYCETDYRIVYDFIESYNEEFEYEIIPTKQDLNSSLEHEEETPKRVTREDLDRAVQSGDNKLIQDYAYQLLEYLEANQKEG